MEGHPEKAEIVVNREYPDDDPEVLVRYEPIEFSAFGSKQFRSLSDGEEERLEETKEQVIPELESRLAGVDLEDVCDGDIIGLAPIGWGIEAMEWTLNEHKQLLLDD